MLSKSLKITFTTTVALAFSALAGMVSPAFAQSAADSAQEQLQRQISAQNSGFAERMARVQAVSKQSPLVYDQAPYHDLFLKLNLNKPQMDAWDRLVRAHQAKSSAMQGMFETSQAVGTLGRIREEIVGVRDLIAPLSSEQRVAPDGLKLTKILKTMDGVEGALRSFYQSITPYQQRDFEIHQVEMIQKKPSR